MPSKKTSKKEPSKKKTSEGSASKSKRTKSSDKAAKVTSKKEQSKKAPSKKDKPSKKVSSKKEVKVAGQDELTKLKARNKELEEKLHYYRMLKETISFCSNQMVQISELPEAMESVLTKVGTELGKHRTIVFQNYVDTEGELYIHTFFEATLGDAKGIEHIGNLENIYLKDVSVDGMNQLMRGQPWQRTKSQFDLREKKFFGILELEQVALVPITVEQGLWGFLLVGDCEKESSMATEELGALLNLTSMMGNCIQQEMTQGAAWSEKVLFEQLFESAQEAIILGYNDGTIIRANEVFLSLFGYEEAEVLGKKIDDLVAPGDLSTDAEEVTRDVSIGVTVEFETVRQTKKGELIDVSVLASPIMVGDEQIGVYGIYRDISERKRNEEALKESEELFKQAIDGSEGGIWYLEFNPEDPELMPDKIYLSPTLKGYIGFDQHEFPNSVAAWHERIHPDDYEGLMRSSRDHREGYTDHHEAYYRIKHKNGTYRWMHTRGKIIRNEDGDPVRWVGIIWDVTDQKEQEMEALTKRDQATLLGDILAHDISNLNLGISGLMDLMVELEGLPEEGKELSYHVIEQSREITNLVANVRKLRNIPVHQQQTEVVDLRDVLVRTSKGVKANYPLKKMTLKHSVKGGKVLLAGNDLLDDVFFNIFGNSMKHSKSDKVKIDVEHKYLRGSKSYRIEISDNGPGIPDVIKSQLFYDLDDAEYTPTGKGIGMTLVKRIVDLFDGEVWVEDKVASDPSKGSKFILILKRGELD